MKKLFGNTFGETVRELREAAQISQDLLSELSEVDRTYISLLERGQRLPSLQTVFLIAKALNTSGSEIIKRMEEKLPEIALSQEVISKPD